MGNESESVSCQDAESASHVSEGSNYADKP